MSDDATWLEAFLRAKHGQARNAALSMSPETLIRRLRILGGTVNGQVGSNVLVGVIGELIKTANGNTSSRNADDDEGAPIAAALREAEEEEEEQVEEAEEGGAAEESAPQQQQQEQQERRSQGHGRNHRRRNRRGDHNNNNNNNNSGGRNGPEVPVLSPEEFSRLRQNCVDTVRDAMERKLGMESRLVVKLAALCDMTFSDIPLELVKQFFQRLVASADVSTSIVILRVFPAHEISTESQLVYLIQVAIKADRWPGAAEIAEHASKDVKMMLIREGEAAGRVKFVHLAVRQWNLVAEFPDAEGNFLVSSIRKFGSKNQWSIAAHYAERSIAGKKILIECMIEANMFEMAKMAIKKYELEDQFEDLTAKQLAYEEANNNSEVYLAPSCSDIHFVDSMSSLTDAVVYCVEALDLMRHHRTKSNNSNDTDHHQEEEKVQRTSSTNSNAEESEGKPPLLVGFDAEWRPRFHKDEEFDVSLVQMAVRDRIFLFDFFRMKHSDETMQVLVDLLRRIFEASHVIKLGFGLSGDLKMMAKSHPGLQQCCSSVWSVLDFESNGFRQLFGVQKGSLSALVQTVLGKKLDKSQQMSDWELRPLSPAQTRYAAMDAHVLLRIFDGISSLLQEQASKGIFLHRHGSNNSNDGGAAAESNEGENAHIEIHGLRHSRAHVATRWWTHCVLPMVHFGHNKGQVRQEIERQVAEEVARARREGGGGEDLGVGQLSLENSMIPLGMDYVKNVAEKMNVPWRPIPSPAALAAANVEENEEKRAVADEGEFIHAKTVVLMHGPDRRPIACICASDQNLSLRLVADAIQVRYRQLRLANLRECVEVFGHEPGSIPPFAFRPIPLHSSKPTLPSYSLSSEPPPSPAAADEEATPTSSSTPTTTATTVTRTASSHPQPVTVVMDARLKDRHGLIVGSGSKDVNLKLTVQELVLLSECTFAYITVPSSSNASLPVIPSTISLAAAAAAAAASLSSSLSPAAAANSSDPSSQPDLKFLCDASLTRLAKYLRCLGRDCEIIDKESPRQVLARAIAEDRIILTKNNMQLASVCPPGRCVIVIGEGHHEEIVEVSRCFHLGWKSSLFLSRCSLCNHCGYEMLYEEARNLPEVPPPIAASDKSLYRCGGCRKVFWEGGKYGQLKSLLHSLVAEANRLEGREIAGVDED